MEELIGKTITKMYVNEDQSLLRFTTDEGKDLLYFAVGDCCSESWFADILFIDYSSDMKFPLTIIEVEFIQMPTYVNNLADKDGRGRQECEQVYGYNIRTSDYTRIEIIYRNSSNGYYGGWCEFADNLDSEWFLDKMKDVVWTEITGDWSA